MWKTKRLKPKHFQMSELKLPVRLLVKHFVQAFPGGDSRYFTLKYDLTWQLGTLMNILSWRTFWYYQHLWYIAVRNVICFLQAEIFCLGCLGCFDSNPCLFLKHLETPEVLACWLTSVVRLHAVCGEVVIQTLVAQWFMTGNVQSWSSSNEILQVISLCQEI